MAIAFDPDKDAANIAKHGISPARAVDLEMPAIKPDDRFPYGKQRFRAWGLIDGVATALPSRPATIGFGQSACGAPMQKEIKRHAP